MKIGYRSVLKQQRVLRIFTFVFFFHFSGLNNGYTTYFVATAQPEKSLEIIRPIIQPLTSSVGSDVSLLQSAHRWVTETVLKLEQFLRESAEIKPSVMLEKAAERSVRGLSFSSFDGFNAESNAYMKRQEAWIGEKDFFGWDELSRPELSREMMISVEKALVNPISPWIKAHQVILRMACHRQMDGGSDDDSGLIQDLRVQIPWLDAGDFYFRTIR